MFFISSSIRITESVVDSGFKNNFEKHVFSVISTRLSIYVFSSDEIITKNMIDTRLDVLR